MTKFYFALVGGHPSPKLHWDQDVTVEADNLEEAEIKIRGMFDESVQIDYLTRMVFDDRQ